ncbi:hypothetical protein [Streptomyces sp. RKAG293]|uniref:hypothetical protein n=1 Tax=Streptomyces sp. RKAG293 TaxID=2893403 RepID=UPI0020341472|nr:hypothetical protein [Streptomyces sp. RKAG293]MCM2417746.1 hypothetical protein [Streptomyces sp. RKAG293]
MSRLTAAFPNDVRVHSPVHASWTNQKASSHSSLFHMTGMAPAGSNGMSGALLWTRQISRR